MYDMYILLCPTKFTSERFDFIVVVMVMYIPNVKGIELTPNFR